MLFGVGRNRGWRRRRCSAGRWSRCGGNRGRVWGRCNPAHVFQLLDGKHLRVLKGRLGSGPFVREDNRISNAVHLQGIERLSTRNISDLVVGRSGARRCCPSRGCGRGGRGHRTRPCCGGSCRSRGRRGGCCASGRACARPKTKPAATREREGDGTGHKFVRHSHLGPLAEVVYQPYGHEVDIALASRVLIADLVEALIFPADR